MTGNRAVCCGLRNNCYNFIIITNIFITFMGLANEQRVLLHEFMWENSTLDLSQLGDGNNLLYYFRVHLFKHCILKNSREKHGIPLSPQGQGQGQGQGPCRCAIWNPWVEHFKRYEEMSKFFYISRSRSRSRSRSMQTLNMSTRSSHHGLYTCAIWNPWVEYFKRYEEMSKFFYISR